MNTTIVIEVACTELTQADVNSLVEDLETAVMQVTNHQEYEGPGEANLTYSHTEPTRQMDVALIRDGDGWATFAVLGTNLSVTKYNDGSLDFLTGLATGFQAAGLNLVSPEEGARA